ncbi:hypothetical protein QBC35DRAFT_86917 [Podospora australis]|uniref:Uncharacterized protein n=1 Tax=Podospora australis TaxID=1536484 RepID=A0AAN7AK82_9PEZI|nr:hypothetical protein QBC35DRAFT_86917 [Podospora australis]
MVQACPVLESEPRGHIMRGNPYLTIPTNSNHGFPLISAFSKLSKPLSNILHHIKLINKSIGRPISPISSSIDTSLADFLQLSPSASTEPEESSPSLTIFLGYRKRGLRQDTCNRKHRRPHLDSIAISPRCIKSDCRPARWSLLNSKVDTVTQKLNRLSTVPEIASLSFFSAIDNLIFFCCLITALSSLYTSAVDWGIVIAERQCYRGTLEPRTVSPTRLYLATAPPR